MAKFVVPGAGFRVNGTPSDSWGAFDVDHDVSPLPNTRDQELDFPGLVGIFDAGSEVSRLDLTWTVGFWTDEGRAAIKALIRTFLADLDPRNGYFTLSWDEDPDFYLNVKLTNNGGSGGVTYQPGVDEIVGTVDLQLKAADPHWYQYSQPSADIAAFTSTTPATVDNPGGSPSPAVVTVVATATVVGSFSVTIGDTTFTYTGGLTSGDHLVIDANTWTVIKNGTVSELAAWTGDMPMVPGGSSTASVSHANLSVTATYVPRTLA